MSESSITSRLENWDESRPLTREEAVDKCAQWKLFPELCVLCTVS